MFNVFNYICNGNFLLVCEYFCIVFIGKFDYSNDVVGFFCLSQNCSFYINNLLVREVFDLVVVLGVNFVNYDFWYEGIFDVLNIMYVGQMQYEGELWLYNLIIDLCYGMILINLYLLISVGCSSVDFFIGIFCYENGYLLCCFFDMYDYGVVNCEGDGV